MRKVAQQCHRQKGKNLPLAGESSLLNTTVGREKYQPFRNGFRCHTLKIWNASIRWQPSFNEDHENILADWRRTRSDKTGE